MSAAIATAPTKLPHHTIVQLRTRPRPEILPDTLPSTMSALPVKSSAPHSRTSSRPRQKQRPPSARCTANPISASPMTTVKNAAPKATNAPANMASTKSFTSGMFALPMATCSAFDSICSGVSASGTRW